MKEPKNRIFCDGACLGNPGPGGWAAIVRLGNKEDVLEIGGGESNTTNNRMELRACLEGMRLFGAGTTKEKLWICTDSRHVIDGASRWIWGWAKKSWKTAQGEDVKNRDLWEAILESLKTLKDHYDIEWKHVYGHKGVPGNERCDEIASAFAMNQSIDLYKGSAADYNYDLDNIGEDLAKNSPSGPHYYLSVINGAVHRDETWAACEARVKGRTGAKFKKCRSSIEEAAILKSWGISS